MAEQSLRDRIIEMKVNGAAIKVPDQIGRRNAHNIACRFNMSIQTWRDRAGKGYWVKRIK